MKQTLEEAAKEYADSLYEPSDRGILYRETQEDFIAGAEWQAKQSPWISANKYPPIDKPLLLNYSNGSVYDMQLGYYDGCHYCNTYGQEVDKHIVGYMPIPSFDEILEANRVKEKGD